MTALENQRRRKKVILHDSHTRGIAAELQHKLEKKFSVQGVVKPGADLSSILNLRTKDTNDLTSDAVVVWEGTRDVSKNETNVSLSHVQNFVKKHNNPNVLLMELPDRYDLNVNSCVHVENKVFNSKLRKYMQPFNHASVMEVNYNRSHYASHGLHLNISGKEYSVTQFQSATERIFNDAKLCPIPMNWVNDHRRQEMCNPTKHMGCNNSLNAIEKVLQTKLDDMDNNSLIMSSMREQRTPISRSNDFYGRRL
jgi:hypothetical protein